MDTFVAIIKLPPEEDNSSRTRVMLEWPCKRGRGLFSKQLGLRVEEGRAAYPVIKGTDPVLRHLRSSHHGSVINKSD